MQQYPQRLAGIARRLRANSTDAERLLWRHLRGKRMCGVRFYRQRPILDYVVDFYCPRARLVIELDGGQHFEARGLTSDSTRDRRLGEAGLRVLRFDNHAVMTNTAAVLEAIELIARERIPL